MSLHLVRSPLSANKKEAIDPTQAYFWTKGWQKMEAEADKAKQAGKVIGNGTAKGLLKALKS